MGSLLVLSLSHAFSQYLLSNLLWSSYYSLWWWWLMEHTEGLFVQKTSLKKSIPGHIFRHMQHWWWLNYSTDMGGLHLKRFTMPYFILIRKQSRDVNMQIFLSCFRLMKNNLVHRYYSKGLEICFLFQGFILLFVVMFYWENTDWNYCRRTLQREIWLGRQPCLSDFICQDFLKFNLVQTSLEKQKR